MSNFIDEIKSRRSIRKYIEKPVSAEVVRSILEAASFAPSAHNAQPWRFVVLTQDEQKNSLANAMAQVWLKELEMDRIPKNIRWATVNRSIERFMAAPVLIVACLTMENMDRYPDDERQRNERDLAVHSIAAAVQTLLLAAHAKGLGACWYCAPVFCKTEVRRALGIPDTVEPQALVTLGYSDESPKVPSRNSFESFVHAEKWGNSF
jgi:coenzyme F420-0:L-glutamate ligase/coenzyme F420-1:gamma-L-glutamate ligase